MLDEREEALRIIEDRLLTEACFDVVQEETGGLVFRS
jgi:hypothetical protein